MKSQNIFCVNFTGAFLYSGTVSLYFSPSLCRATRIKLHHSQGFSGLSNITTHKAGRSHFTWWRCCFTRGCMIIVFTGNDRVSAAEGIPPLLHREPHIGKYEVFIREIKVLLKLPLTLLYTDTAINTLFSQAFNSRCEHDSIRSLWLSNICIMSVFKYKI